MNLKNPNFLNWTYNINPTAINAIAILKLTSVVGAIIYLSNQGNIVFKKSTIVHNKLENKITKNIQITKDFTQNFWFSQIISSKNQYIFSNNNSNKRIKRFPKYKNNFPDLKR